MNIEFCREKEYVQKEDSRYLERMCVCQNFLWIEGQLCIMRKIGWVEKVEEIGELC